MVDAAMDGDHAAAPSEARMHSPPQGAMAADIRATIWERRVSKVDADWVVVVYGGGHDPRRGEHRTDTYRLHRLFLASGAAVGSSGSHFFRKAFRAAAARGDAAAESTLRLPLPCTGKNFEAVLRYLYEGSFEPVPANVIHVLRVAIAMGGKVILMPPFPPLFVLCQKSIMEHTGRMKMTRYRLRLGGDDTGHRGPAGGGAGLRGRQPGAGHGAAVSPAGDRHGAPGEAHRRSSADPGGRVVGGYAACVTLYYAFHSCSCLS